MSSLRGNFADLLTPGFIKIFDDGYNFKAPSSVMEKVFNIDSSEKDTEKVSAITGFGYPVQTSEGGTIDYEDPVQMYDTTYTHQKYTKGFKVSRELVEDDLYNVIKGVPKALGMAFRRWQERSAAQVFNRAFNSTYVGGDSEELCSTSHDRSDGGTAQSNASSTGITLTEANLETAIIAFRGQLDDKGMRIDVFPDTLIVPIDLRKTARLIVESPSRQGTADNDKNIYHNEFKVLDWIYMDRVTTHWFLLDSSQKQLQWYWRVKPEFKQDDSFDTDMALYKARARWSNGWNDWRGVWGSQGDAAAYSG